MSTRALSRMFLKLNQTPSSRDERHHRSTPESVLLNFTYSFMYCTNLFHGLNFNKPGDIIKQNMYIDDSPY